MITDRLGLDAVVIEQLARVPRVFTGDQGNFLEDSRSAVSEVFKISDGSSNNIERSGHECILHQRWPNANSKRQDAESQRREEHKTGTVDF